MSHPELDEGTNNLFGMSSNKAVKSSHEIHALVNLKLFDNEQLVMIINAKN